MKAVRVGDIDIAYEQIGPVGRGDPMLLIHGSNLADGLRPLAAALNRQVPSLPLVRYHRRGVGRSTGGLRPVTTEQQAADALGVLDALELPAAHILGYSYGATIALEVALSAPDRIRSLVLLEPILHQVPSWQDFSRSMEPVMESYAAGDLEAAVKATFLSLGGPQWPGLIDSIGPDALSDAIRDTEVYFRVEAPAMRQWTLDPRRSLAAPVVSVLGDRSGLFFAEGRQLLHQRFPQCVDADITDATHMLFLQQPDAIADAVRGFLAPALPG